MNADFGVFLSGIESLNKLFRSGADASSETPGDGGILFPRTARGDTKYGSLFGLISGPAGAGKTLLALQIAATQTAAYSRQTVRDTLVQCVRGFTPIMGGSLDARLDKEVKEVFGALDLQGVPGSPAFDEVVNILSATVVKSLKTSDDGTARLEVAIDEAMTNGKLSSLVQQLNRRHPAPGVFFSVDQDPFALAQLVARFGWLSLDRIAVYHDGPAQGKDVTEEFAEDPSYAGARLPRRAQHFWVFDRDTKSWKPSATGLPTSEHELWILPALSSPHDAEWLGGTEEAGKVASGRGADSLANALSERLSDLLELVYDLTIRTTTPEPRPSVIVIDSVSALAHRLNVPTSHAALRRTLLKLRDVSAGRRWHVLYLFEETSGSSVLENVQGEEFVPDVAMRLSVDGQESARRRGLEIVKARHQPFFRGRHDLAIIEPAVGDQTAGAFRGPVFEYPSPRPGIVVSPNLSTKIFRYDAQRRTPPMAEDRLSTGIRELDLMLTDLDPSVQNIPAEPQRGVPRHSTTAIIAERGTGATRLGLHFLAAGCKNNERCLLLSFDHDEELLFSEFNRYPFLRDNLMDGDLMDDDGIAFGWKEGVFVQARIPVTISPERLIQRVQDFLDHAAAMNSPIKRAVVDNLGVLQKRYPALASEPLLAEALKNLFLSRRVTPILIDIVPAIAERGRAQRHDSLVEHLCENVIAIGHVELRGRHKKVLVLRQAIHANPRNEPHELVTRRANDGTFETTLSPAALEPYTDLFSGHAIQVPLNLALYVDEDEANGANDEDRSPVSRYKRSLVETFRVSLPKVEASYFGPKEHSKIIGAPSSWGDVPRPDTFVIEFDGYWIHELEQRRLIDNLGQLAGMDEASAGIENGQAGGATWIDSFLRPIASPFRVPHYIDMGMFVSRRVDAASHVGLPPPSWKRLLSLVEAEPDRWRNASTWWETPLFDFDKTVDEAKTCMFLELLLSFLAPLRRALVGQSEEYVSRFGALAIDDSFFRHDASEHLEAGNSQPLRVWCTGESLNADERSFNEAVLDACLTLKGLFPEDEQIKRHLAYSSRCNGRAEYQRQWYSTLGKTIARERAHDSGASARGTPTPQPRYQVFAGMPAIDASDVPRKYSSPVVGTWHLAIARGSLSPRMGLRAIKEMTCVQADNHKLIEMIGLPARKRFYENDVPDCLPHPIVRSPSPRAFQAVYESGFSRAWIRQYRELSPVLLNGFRDILLAPQDAAFVASLLGKTQARIDTLYR